MALAELKELSNNVNALTVELRCENGKVKQIFDEFARRFPVPNKSKNTIEAIKNGLAEIKADLEDLQKQATDKIVIEFIGSVNAGKSSLINALLREAILPATCEESTMCSFKICTAKEETWSAQKDGGVNIYEKDVDEIKKLYCKMADSTNREKQKKLNINTESLVQVNWPQKLCQTLPENVILYDTPGIGNDKKVSDLIEKSCRTADIIVAVIDAMSPLLTPVSNLTSSHL